MPRKPNYRLERSERERRTAEKPAARREAKAAQLAEKKEEAPEDPVATD